MARILQVVNSSGAFGPEQLLIPNIQFLQDGVELVVLRETRTGASLKDLYSLCKRYDVSVTCIDVKGRMDRLAIDQLATLISDSGVDVVHAHDVKASLFALLASRRVKHRPCLVSTHHGIKGRPNLLTKLYEALYVHFVLPHFDRVLAVSGSDAALLRIRTGYSHIREHRNGIQREIYKGTELDSIRIESRCSWEMEQPSPFVVALVGRVSAEKDPFRFLEVAKAAILDFPSSTLQFLIVGDGPLLPSVESYIRENGLSRNVKAVGQRDNFGHREILGIDCLLSVSKAEGLPIGVLEALIHQKPVLAHNSDGCAEILAQLPPFCSLAEVDPPSLIARKLIALSRDRDLYQRIVQAGTEVCSSVYSGEQWGANLGLIYEELLRKRPGDYFTKNSNTLKILHEKGTYEHKTPLGLAEVTDSICA